MNIQIPPIQAVRLVLHWFSEWNNSERELFLSTLNCLETVDHHLSIDDSLSIISEMNTNEHDNSSIHQNNTIGHQMNDTFLAHLMNTNLQINSEFVERSDSSDIFQCQIRLFHFWYPHWSLEQRVQLVSNLKDIQLKSLNGIS